MQLYPAAFSKLILPAVLITVAYFARAWIDQLANDFRVIVDYLPYFFCAVAMFMAYQFNSCRLLLASIGIALFYWAVQGQLQLF